MIRTNQFNTTTMRYTAEKIRNLLSIESNYCLTVKVSDRFGDYGLAGVIICSVQDNLLSVDNFILSCRVLGKGVEHKVLSTIGQMAIDKGKDFVLVKYIKSPQNTPVKDFLDGTPFDSNEISGVNEIFMFTAVKCKKIRFSPHNAGDEDRKKTSNAGEKALIIRPDKNILKNIPIHFTEIENIIAEIGKERENQSIVIDHGKKTPQNDTEKKVAMIYKDILKLDIVGIEKNFFALGGTSLLLVQLCGKLEEYFDREVSVTDLFKYPTVQSLAAYLNNDLGIEIYDKGRMRGEKKRSLLLQFKKAKLS